MQLCGIYATISTICYSTYRVKKSSDMHHLTQNIWYTQFAIVYVINMEYVALVS